MVVDEVQTGFGRTGKMMAADWEGIRPDMLAMGKSMSGGVVPASGVVCDAYIMDGI